MTEREKVIGFLQEMAEYFRECRSNASFGSEEEIRFWEMQNAANETAELLKEQQNEYEKGFNDAMLGKQELMYEGEDGEWYKKEW